MGTGELAGSCFSEIALFVTSFVVFSLLLCCTLVTYFAAFLGTGFIIQFLFIPESIVPGIREVLRLFARQVGKEIQLNWVQFGRVDSYFKSTCQYVFNRRLLLTGLLCCFSNV